jgi:hypothetical protein
MIQRKKIQLTITLMCALCTGTQAQSFGRYADCTTGRGICGIGIENIGDEATHITSQKFIIGYKTDSTLQLRIVKDRITAADEVKIFGSTVASLPKGEPVKAYVDLAIPVTEMLRSLLTIPAKYTTIAAGIYTASSTGNFFITELKLQ